MIQDIFPSRLDNAFFSAEIKDGDIVLEFDVDGRILACEDAGGLLFKKMYLSFLPHIIYGDGILTTDSAGDVPIGLFFMKKKELYDATNAEILSIPGSIRRLSWE